METAKTNSFLIKSQTYSTVSLPQREQAFSEIYRLSSLSFHENERKGYMASPTVVMETVFWLLLITLDIAQDRKARGVTLYRCWPQPLADYEKA